MHYTGQTKVVLVESSYCKPFPLEPLCQHGSGQVYLWEYLISLSNLKGGDSLTVPYFSKLKLNTSTRANFLPPEVDQLPLETLGNSAGYDCISINLMEDYGTSTSIKYHSLR